MRFKNLSIIASIIFLIIGFSSILNIISLNVLYLEAILVIIGLLIMGRSLDKKPNRLSIISFVAGVLFVLVGILPILINFYMLRFIPFSINLSVHVLFLEIILIVSSVYLIIDSL